MKNLSAGMLVLLSALLLVPGCANQSIATLAPGTDLSKVKNFYVVKLATDKHGVDILIQDRLTKLGYAAKRGPEMPAADYNADIVVTYRDKWVWDMSMYMIDLTITFRAPDNGFPMATGYSMHTSLTRKSPEEMVEEVLASIFNKAKPNPQ